MWNDDISVVSPRNCGAVTALAVLAGVRFNSSFTWVGAAENSARQQCVWADESGQGNETYSIIPIYTCSCAHRINNQFIISLVVGKL